MSNLTILLFNNFEDKAVLFSYCYIIFSSILINPKLDNLP